MPLWKLQTIGRECVDFLYENTGTGRTIELRPGVAFCFRKFHALVADLVRGAWVGMCGNRTCTRPARPQTSTNSCSEASATISRRFGRC